MDDYPPGWVSIWKREGKIMKNSLAVFGLVLLLLIQPVLGDSLDFSIAVTAEEADYRGRIAYNCDSGNRAKYNQYFNAAKQQSLSLESTGSFDSTNSFAIETNYTGVRMPLSLIGDTNFVENVGTGTTNNNTAGCTKCVSGIMANADSVMVSSIASTTQTSLSHAYAIEIREGKVAAGYRKVNDNVTAESINRIRAKTAMVIGHTECVFPPTGPTTKKNIKESICPWGGKGVGYPIFNGHIPNGNESRNGNRT